MTLAIVAVILGLVLLVWSADRFVEGSAAAARHFGVPPLLIGMVVVGFGTSAPEIVVSTFASLQGNPGIALGNAFGSNITNIALILGLTALINPIIVESRILRKELPILTVITGLVAVLLWDHDLSRLDALILLIVFTALMSWTIYQGLRHRKDALADEIKDELKEHAMPIKKALTYLATGMVVLMVSSRILVWGAVKIAVGFGVSDIIIGLTVVAIGTSLPELAASLIATRKGEHDIAIGNVIGSNLFNTLAVVGIAGAIAPTTIGPEVFSRDIMVMGALTVSLFIFGYGFRTQGRINRTEGGVLLACYIAYNAYLAISVFGG